MRFPQFLVAITLIELSFKFIGELKIKAPFVAVLTLHKLKSSGKHRIAYWGSDNHLLIDGANLGVQKQNLKFEEGEILLVFPEQKLIQRFYRPTSNANTILLTEQCDQRCMMCSQPPKNKDYLHWSLYL